MLCNLCLAVSFVLFGIEGQERSEEIVDYLKQTTSACVLGRRMSNCCEQDSKVTYPVPLTKWLAAREIPTVTETD